MRPQPGTYPDYFENYIPLIKNENLVDALVENWEKLSGSLAHVSESKANFAYAEGKWTLKQVIQHMTDTERVIAYRALRFARKDPQQPLPFEENNYAAAAELDNRDIKNIMAEFETVRKATISLFASFSAGTLQLKGKTSFGDTSVLALGYLIAGHALHHLNVIKERYL